MHGIREILEIHISDLVNFYPSTDHKLGKKAVRRIPVTRGNFAIVDADDYYRLVQFRWHSVGSNKTLYAARRPSGKAVMMHRWIMNAPDHLVVDHIDHNGLNNCKANLRLCTIAQNTCNAGSNAGATSRYKGVSWKKNAKKWSVTIQLNKKRFHIG